MRDFHFPKFHKLFGSTILRHLAATFCQETVATYSDEDLQRVAAELPEDVSKRKQLRVVMTISLRVFVVYESDVLKRCCPR
jgi:hypothetical protein